MKTCFTFLHKSLILERYPRHLSHPSWQAWDSADELLIEHIEQSSPITGDTRFLIINDDFGALTNWFARSKVYHVTDSFVARLACQQNLASNQLSESNVTFLSSLCALPSKPDWVIVKIPKTTALLEQQLIDLQDVVGEDTQIVAAAKAKSIQKSTLSLFEKYLGKTHTSLAKKKSRLIFCQPRASIKPCLSPYPTSWRTDDGNFTLSNDANVFSRGQMDIGARMLVNNLPNCSNKSVIDLGCGNGIVGLHVLHRFIDSQVHFVDESFMAVHSARHNVAHNLPDALPRSEFLVSNCLQHFNSNQPVEVVICNPPFHQQNTITDHIAEQMFEDAFCHLKKGGELRIIGNRHLDYPQKLKRVFGGYQVIASDKKFSILSAFKSR